MKVIYPRKVHYELFAQITAYCGREYCDQKMLVIGRKTKPRKDEVYFETIKLICPCCGAQYYWLRGIRKWGALVES